ncbi:MAG: hypothetical protein Q7R54_00690 [bacterium]|nr:hypothetical protein [bacterium]
MRWIYWFLVGLGVVILLLLGFYLFRSDTTPPNTIPGITDPFGTPAGTVPGTGGGSTETQLPITLNNGAVILVPNFTKASQPFWTSPIAGYEVAGSEKEIYHILYFPGNSGFLISLAAEPLGESRRAGEAALRAKLGVTDAVLCTLNIQVFTGIDVNEQYSGRDLGLSFCPGATALP